MEQPVPTSPVVVGIDGSRASIDAALWAADEALTRGASLRLVHVIDVEDELYRDLDDVPAEVARDWPETETGRTSLRAAVTAVRDSRKPVSVESAILWGEIAPTLVEESHRATMVCVGSTGVSSLGRRLFGSTAVILAEQAHSSVAIVRYPRSLALSEPDWIVAAVDGGPDSDSILACAVDEAHLRGAPVLAGRFSCQDPEGIHIDELTDRIVAWRKDRPQLRIYPVVVPTDVVEFLAQHDGLSVQLAVVGAADADETAAIVGPHRKTRQPNGRCSVLVVR